MTTIITAKSQLTKKYRFFRNIYGVHQKYDNDNHATHIKYTKIRMDAIRYMTQ